MRKNLKKQTKTKEANRKHSEIPTVGRWGWVGARLGKRGRPFWDPTSSGHIYNRKDKGWGGVREGCGGSGGGWGQVCRLIWDGGHLHRSTGLRSWTARDWRDRAKSVGLLHPLLSSRECSSHQHSLSRKTNERNNTSHENIKQKGIREQNWGLKSMNRILEIQRQA